ncbi:hypothetical protein SLOPH_600 [Spraguea lophii 42_110]|uniref:Uncharacterized protein n=1 Tax=Spraguea lophii (strain 42_110) TaxID=1358809 RepID=S7W565_SPRLO|nr:hypothetical protein SLOPH_600 [Spraguea lophii 42_110]
MLGFLNLFINYMKYFETFRYNNKMAGSSNILDSKEVIIKLDTLNEPGYEMCGEFTEMSDSFDEISGESSETNDESSETSDESNETNDEHTEICSSRSKTPTRRTIKITDIKYVGGSVGFALGHTFGVICGSPSINLHNYKEKKFSIQIASIAFSVTAIVDNRHRFNTFLLFNVDTIPYVDGGFLRGNRKSVLINDSRMCHDVTIYFPKKFNFELLPAEECFLKTSRHINYSSHDITAYKINNLTIKKNGKEYSIMELLFVDTDTVIREGIESESSFSVIEPGDNPIIYLPCSEGRILFTCKKPHKPKRDDNDKDEKKILCEDGAMQTEKNSKVIKYDGACSTTI